MFSGLLYTHSGYQSASRSVAHIAAFFLFTSSLCAAPAFHWLLFHISVSPKPVLHQSAVVVVVLCCFVIDIHLYKYLYSAATYSNKYCSLLLSHCAQALLHAGASAIINIEQFSSQAPLTRAINNSSCNSPGLSRLGSSGEQAASQERIPARRHADGCPCMLTQRRASHMCLSLACTAVLTCMPRTWRGAAGGSRSIKVGEEK